jgi:hypothetical protein
MLLALARMALDERDAFNDGALLACDHFNDLAALAFLGAGDDDHFVAFPDVKSLHKC